MKQTPTLSNDAGVMDGILLWVTVAILLIVMLPVLSSLLTVASPVVWYNSTDPNTTLWLSYRGGVLNTTAAATTTMVGSSYGLMIVVLIILAAVVILGVVAYLRGGQQKR